MAEADSEGWESPTDFSPGDFPESSDAGDKEDFRPAAVDIELEPPLIRSKQPAMAGSELMGQVSLNVFNQLYVDGADLCVHVEVEGDSWCRPLSQSRSLSPAPPSTTAILDRTASVVRRVAAGDLHRRVSITFTDDDYPKAFHFLERIPVWPRPDQDSLMEFASEDQVAGIETKLLNVKFPSPQSPRSGRHLSPSDSDLDDGDTTTQLFGSGNSLDVGHYSWSFKCCLPESLCTSVELPCTHGIGGVRYRLRTAVTRIKDGHETTLTSEWTRFELQQEVDITHHLSQDVEEQCISSADTPSLRLPWMSYQLKARMAKPATARGGVLHIQFCLKRQHSRMKSMSVQADLLQRITLNFGGKSTTPITVPGQKLARSNGQPGGLMRQFHNLHTDTVECKSAAEHNGKLLLYVPQQIIPTFRLPRVSVDYFVEIKVVGSGKRSIILPITIGTIDNSPVTIPTTVPAGMGKDALQKAAEMKEASKSLLSPSRSTGLRQTDL